jgi:transposase-like protein
MKAIRISGRTTGGTSRRRVEEAYVKAGAAGEYLSRAVESAGRRTVGFVLSADATFARRNASLVSLGVPGLILPVRRA